MSNSNSPQLHIESPCPKSWATLDGNARKRFCSQCQLHVHNSEELTEREAQQIVQESKGRACMRVVTDANGQPKFKAEPEPIGLRRIRAAGLALAASGILAACQPTSPAELPDIHAVDLPEDPGGDPAEESQNGTNLTDTSLTSHPVIDPHPTFTGVQMGIVATPPGEWPLDSEPGPIAEPPHQNLLQGLPLETLGEVVLMGKISVSSSDELIAHPDEKPAEAPSQESATEEP